MKIIQHNRYEFFFIYTKWQSTPISHLISFIRKAFLLVVNYEKAQSKKKIIHSVCYSLNSVEFRFAKMNQSFGINNRLQSIITIRTHIKHISRRSVDWNHFSHIFIVFSTFHIYHAFKAPPAVSVLFSSNFLLFFFLKKNNGTRIIRNYPSLFGT